MKVNKNNFSIEHFHNSFLVKTDDMNDLGLCRSDHLDYALNYVNIPGEFLEFGVYKARSTNRIAKRFPNKIIYGFDSFEGLPEDWNISLNPKKNKHVKGYFSLDNLPKVESNVKLLKGWFEDTLPKYIRESNIKQVSFLHIDGDLYSSAKTVFDNLEPFIVNGTIIVFDELYPWGRKRYETWEEHEFKALKEWTHTFDRQFEIISHSGHQQCCIKIIK